MSGLSSVPDTYSSQEILGTIIIFIIAITTPSSDDYS